MRTAASPGVASEPDTGDTGADAGRDEPRRRAIDAVRLVPFAVLGVAAIGISAIYYPGHMSADTLTQIAQVRSGHFSAWHAPILLSIWRLAWIVVPSTGYVLVTTVFLFLVAVYVLLRTALRRVAAVALTLALAATPMALGFLGVLSRDTWFTALLLTAFACYAQATRHTGRLRQALAVAGLAASWLALASRQNSVPAVLVACFVAVWLLRSDPARPTAVEQNSRIRRLTRHLVPAALLVAFGVSQLVYVHVILHVPRAEPEQALYLYDLIMISRLENRLMVDPRAYPAADLELLRQRTSVGSIDGALASQPILIEYPVDPDIVDDLQRDWLHAIKEYPGSYLKARMQLWLEQLGITANVQWIQHPFIDPNSWGYAPAFPGINDAAVDYVTAFAASPSLDGGPLYEVWVYLLVDIAACGYLLVADPRRKVLGALALATVAYEVGLLPIAMGNQYRFSYPVVVVAMVVAMVGAFDLARAALASRNRRRLAAPALARAEQSGSISPVPSLDRGRRTGG